MASGTIYGTTSNEYIDAKVEWSSTPNVVANTSTVKAALYYKRNNTGYNTYGSGRFSITIANESLSKGATITITESAWVKAVELTQTISHNSDGSKSITISASGSIPDTSLTSTTLSGTAKLDTIASATTLDSISCSTKYFTGTMTYKYTPKSASLYNRCVIALNQSGTYTQVKDIKLGKKTASQQTATVTLSGSELSTIYNKLPNGKEGYLRFTFRTYSDSGYSTQVGDGVAKELLLTIPNENGTKPTASMNLSSVNSLASPFDKLYIMGKSKVKAVFTSGTGYYGATIKSYIMTVNGKSYGSPYTSEYLTKSGSVAVTGKITDSRGFSNTYTKTITVIPYTSPRLLPASNESEIICARCDANGNLSDSGTYLKIKAKRSYSKVTSSGVQNNFCSIRYRYKAEKASSYSSWTTVLATGASSDEVNTSALLGGVLSTTSSYVVQVGVVDTLGEAESITFNIPTDKVYMHRAGSRNSLGIGKYVEEENTVDIAEDITTKFRGKVRFAGEAWLNLGLSANVAESESNCGRWGGTGCYYRVCAGEKHVYVAFNCAFTYANSAIQVNADAIPSEYRPKRNVYAMCATGGRAVARILVNDDGNILVDWIQVLTATSSTTSSTVKWIDGYIDYWT